MRRRAKIFELLSSKDINGHKMDFGVTVLASLGGRHFHNLAGTTLDHHETVLPQSRALHGICGRSPRIGALEGMLMLVRSLFVSHGRERIQCAKRWKQIIVGQSRGK